MTETRFFGFMCHLTYAPATLRRRLKNLVSVGSLPPFSVFAKLQLDTNKLTSKSLHFSRLYAILSR